jgi:hypothetical protein
VLAGYTVGSLFWAAAWNLALADAEVAALANGTPPWLVRTGSLVEVWPLEVSGDFGGRSGVRLMSPVGGVPTPSPDPFEVDLVLPNNTEWIGSIAIRNLLFGFEGKI